MAGLATPCPATAVDGYAVTRAGWVDLSDSRRQAYVAGVFDTLLMVRGESSTSEEFRASAGFSEGLSKCAVSLSLKPADIAIMVDRYYDDVAHWSHAPRSAVFVQLFKACKADIEAGQRARGLASVKR